MLSIHAAKSRRKDTEKQVNEWLNTGVIVPSESSWAAPVVLVSKKGTDKMRMCVNYRKLNNMTIKDSFLLPIIDNIMHSIGKASHFGTLDLANGFMQIPMQKEDQEKPRSPVMWDFSSSRGCRLDFVMPRQRFRDR